MSVDYFTCYGCLKASIEYVCSGHCEKCGKTYCEDCKDNLNKKDYSDYSNTYSKCKLCNKRWKLVKISD